MTSRSNKNTHTLFITKVQWHQVKWHTWSGFGFLYKPFFNTFKFLYSILFLQSEKNKVQFDSIYLRRTFEKQIINFLLWPPTATVLKCQNAIDTFRSGYSTSYFSIIIALTSSIKVLIRWFLLVEDYGNIKLSIFFFCRSLHATEVPKGVHSTDISRHSDSYFFNTTCFTPFGKVSISNFFTGRRLFRKILFSLLPNPDRPITPKMLLMNTDLGFQIHITPKLHPRFLPSMAQSTTIYLRMNTQ